MLHVTPLGVAKRVCQDTWNFSMEVDMELPPKGKYWCPIPFSGVSARFWREQPNTGTERCEAAGLTLARAASLEAANWSQLFAAESCGLWGALGCFGVQLSGRGPGLVGIPPGLPFFVWGKSPPQKTQRDVLFVGGFIVEADLGHQYESGSLWNPDPKTIGVLGGRVGGRVCPLRSAAFWGLTEDPHCRLRNSKLLVTPKINVSYSVPTSIGSQFGSQDGHLARCGHIDQWARRLSTEGPDKQKQVPG